MYGVRNIDSLVLHVSTMMRLRGKKSDASKFIATGTAFSDFVALLPVGVALQSRRVIHIRETLKRLGNMLRSKCEALTMRPSGPANTPLRSVSAVH